MVLASSCLFFTLAVHLLSPCIVQQVRLLKSSTSHPNQQDDSMLFLRDVCKVHIAPTFELAKQAECTSKSYFCFESNSAAKQATFTEHGVVFPPDPTIIIEQAEALPNLSFDHCKQAEHSLKSSFNFELLLPPQFASGPHFEAWYALFFPSQTFGDCSLSPLSNSQYRFNPHKHSTEITTTVTTVALRLPLTDSVITSAASLSRLHSYYPTTLDLPTPSTSTFTYLLVDSRSCVLAKSLETVTTDSTILRNSRHPDSTDIEIIVPFQRTSILSQPSTLSTSSPSD
jgi:hypothetical protein